MTGTGLKARMNIVVCRRRILCAPDESLHLYRAFAGFALIKRYFRRSLAAPEIFAVAAIKIDSSPFAKTRAFIASPDTTLHKNSIRIVPFFPVSI
jgi:hypothetical protein